MDNKGWIGLAFLLMIAGWTEAQTSTPDASTSAEAPSPSNGSAHFRNFKEAYKSGNQDIKERKWASAAESYSIAASLALNDKSKSQALNSQGWALLKQKKWRSAQSVLIQAVKVDGTNKTAEKNLGVASYRLYEYGLGGLPDLKMAIVNLETGGDTDLVELAKGAQAREDSYAQVTPSAEPKLEGLSYKSLAALGNKFQVQGQFDLALKIFKKAGLVARSAVSKGNAANLQGLVLLDARRPHESIPFFEEAVKNQPNEKVYLNNLGYGYWMFYDSGKGDEETLKKAVDAFYKSNAIDPSFHKDNLVMALGELKELDPEAAKQYSTSTEKPEEIPGDGTNAPASTLSSSSPEPQAPHGEGDDEGKDPK